MLSFVLEVKKSNERVMYVFGLLGIGPRGSLL